jgi:hypothetical protein
LKRKVNSLRYAVEVRGAHRALVDAQQPALQQARDSLHARHHSVRGIVLLADDRSLVCVPALGHGPVRLPPIGVDRRPGLHHLLDEREQ